MTKQSKNPAIYIMASGENGTLYTGVTSDLIKRVSEHKAQSTKGFTSKYDCNLLVYYEQYETMEEAIEREKQLKGGSRKKKLQLINNFNNNWTDLYNSIL